MMRKSVPRMLGNVPAANRKESGNISKWYINGTVPTTYVSNQVDNLAGPKWSYTGGTKPSAMFDGNYVPWVTPMVDRMRQLMRHSGRNLIRLTELMNANRPTESLLRLRRVVNFEGKKPEIRDNCFVAPNALVLGDVFLGRKVSVGYGAVVRGDLAPVKIGESSHVGDKAVILPGTKIGKWCVIDPMAVVDGAQVCSCSMVGSAAIVMKDAKIESNALLCAASVLQRGTVIPSGEVWSGNPAEKIGTLTDEEKEQLIKAAKHEVAIAVGHADSWSQSWEEQENYRIGREYWSRWADGQTEMRMRGVYTKEGPKENAVSTYSSPAEMCFQGGGSMGAQNPEF